MSPATSGRGVQRASCADDESSPTHRALTSSVGTIRPFATSGVEYAPEQLGAHYLVDVAAVTTQAARRSGSES